MAEKKVKKPLYKRWWFWILVALFCLFVVFPILTNIIMSFSASDSNDTPKLSKSAKIAKNNWKHHKIVFKDGTFKIDTIARSKFYDEDEDGFRKFAGGGAFVVGTYTNKSNKEVNVTDFWQKHVEVRAYDDNGYWTLTPVSYAVKDDDDGQEYHREDIDVEPGKSVKVAINNVGDRGKNVPNMFRFKLMNHHKKVWMSEPEKYRTMEIQ